jgi:glycosyltransferase involved in cell wall biosynthesis
MSSLVVTLGPEAYLHRGYHGTLLEYPPRAVEYSLADPTVVFTSYARTPAFHPCHHFAVRECHVYDDHPHFIHSVHFPVANQDARWLLETDSLLAHLQYGNVVFNRQFSTWVKDSRTRSLVAERLANMLELVASPQCVALVFHSQGQLERNKEQCLSVMPHDWSVFVQELFTKAAVCYPGQPTRIHGDQLRLRNANARRGIVFAASGFKEKGGYVTLELYRRLLSRRDVELCYFGPIPLDVRTEFSDVLSRILYAPQIPRAILLEVFKEAHILVAPSRHEALGITFFEALSSGLAIVTTHGPGMENVSEVVQQGVGGILVEKPSVYCDPPVEAVHEAVVGLLEAPDRYRAMSEHNLSLIQDGPFSIARRDETLLAAYRACESREIAPPRNTPARMVSLSDRDDHAGHYSCRSSAVARARLRESFLATESSLVVPALSIVPASQGAILSARGKRLLSELPSLPDLSHHGDSQ